MNYPLRGHDVAPHDAVPAQQAEQELRVATSTNVQLLATSIVRNVEEGKRVTLSCIGVQPVSQAVKAVAIANGQVAPHGMVFFISPAFHVAHFKDRESNEDVERTVMRLTIVVHRIGG